MRSPVEDHDIVSSLSHNIKSQTHSRMSECDGRPPVQVEPSAVNRMVTASAGVQTDLPKVVHSSCRSICHSSEPQSSTVRISSPRLFTDASNKCWGAHLDQSSTKGLWSDPGKMATLNESLNPSLNFRQTLRVMQTICLPLQHVLRPYRSSGHYLLKHQQNLSHKPQVLPYNRRSSPSSKSPWVTLLISSYSNKWESSRLSC